jgi:hypothetical protein
MVAGVSKKFSNRFKAIYTYFWDMTTEAISKMQITFKDKARADPPSLEKLWRDRRKSGAYTRVCEHFEEVRNTVIGS